jgi:hypothetical protein
MKLFSFIRYPHNKRSLNRSRISFEKLSKVAYEYLFELQENCKSTYKLSEYTNWFYEQATGKLTFSDDGVEKLIIDYEKVGSVSYKTNTWLWAWANPHLEDKIKSEITAVRDYGLERNFEKLVAPKWEAEEADGWEMTAIAAYLLSAKGAYRVPNKENNLHSFLIFKEIRWADAQQ